MTTETTATDAKTAADPQGNGANPQEPKPKAKKRGRPKGATGKKTTKTAAKKPADKPKPPPPPAETTATVQGPGRPKGSQGKIPEVVGSLTRCKKCDSTERTRYYGIISREYSGERDGKPFNRVTWKRTTCANCNQARTDVFYEMTSGR